MITVVFERLHEEILRQNSASALSPWSESLFTLWALLWVHQLGRSNEPWCQSFYQSFIMMKTRLISIFPLPNSQFPQRPRPSRSGWAQIQQSNSRPGLSDVQPPFWSYRKAHMSHLLSLTKTPLSLGKFQGFYKSSIPGTRDKDQIYSLSYHSLLLLFTKHKGFQLNLFPSGSGESLKASDFLSSYYGP